MTVDIHPNGFISVWDDRGARFTVQGITRHALTAYSLDPANASRASCSCPNGFTELSRDECEHKKAVRAKVRAQMFERR
jgi:hypothetical protein